MKKENLKTQILLKAAKADELKKEFNKMVKIHGEMKKLISTVTMNFQLIKTIAGYEHREVTVPEDRYVTNILSTINRDMDRLRTYYRSGDLK